jgi:mannosyl-glycoprotein endo-beta-N-acetylglucosaminidase
MICSEDRLGICYPLKSLQELQSWNPAFSSAAGSRMPLVKSVGPKCNRPKLLACHDMKGGYLEDRFIQGTVECNSYTFWNWWLIDSFVYFSHEFVTIPPPCWIDAGHRHGVAVLGTFITEWDVGRDCCLELLSTPEMYRAVADKLVAIATWHGFDGWLINIENPLQHAEVTAMQNFVQYLTQEMHNHLPDSQVIWYDSITNDGKLDWQNELNDQNRLFFESCDGIFLNYTWTAAHLERSQAVARQLGRQYDVYVGVDVFGRGCLGGGGFSTAQATSVAKEFDLSVALFAHGWTFETAVSFEEFLDNERRFWHLLQDYCPQRRLLTHLPLVTSFCRGYGHKYFLNGQNVFNHRWTNMSLQCIQPNVTNSVSPAAEAAVSQDFVVDYTTDDAFNGGGCLQITSPTSTSRICRICLFECDAAVDAINLFVSYTYKPMPSNVNTNTVCSGSHLSLILVCESPSMTTFTSRNIVEYHLTDFRDETNKNCGNVCETNGIKRLLIEPHDDDSRCGINADKANGGWITRSYYLVGLTNECRLTQISLSLTANTSEIFLGQLQVIPCQGNSQYAAHLPPAVNGIVVNARLAYDDVHQLQLLPSNGCCSDSQQQQTPVLSWTVPQQFHDLISHYVVYVHYAAQLSSVSVDTAVSALQASVVAMVMQDPAGCNDMVCDDEAAEGTSRKVKEKVDSASKDFTSNIDQSTNLLLRDHSTDVVPDPCTGSVPFPNTSAVPGLMPDPYTGVIPEPYTGSVPDHLTRVVPDPYTGVVPEPYTDVVPDPYTGVIPDPYTGVVLEPYTDVVPDPYTGVIPEPYIGGVHDHLPRIVLDPCSGVIPEPYTDVVPDPYTGVIPEPYTDGVPDPYTGVIPEPYTGGVPDHLTRVFHSTSTTPVLDPIANLSESVDPVIMTDSSYQCVGMTPQPCFRLVDQRHLDILTAAFRVQPVLHTGHVLPFWQIELS